jgi:hypothetical protein
MFWLGVLIGLVVACALLWWLYGPDGVLRLSSPPADPRQAVFDMERLTIDSMLSAEMAARQNGNRPGDDVIEGTARDITRRP